MSNQKYPNTNPFAHERNTNVNFNYVWDENDSNWIPQSESSITSSYILSNAKNFVHKFGSVKGISSNAKQDKPYTICDQSSDVAVDDGKYIFPNDAGESLNIVSSENDDAEKIIVIGLNENFEEKEEEITLTGTTPLALSGKWSRVFRAYNNGVNDLVGDISIKGLVNTYAKILAGNNQTLMALYTIPADCTGYLLKHTITAQNISSASAIGFTIDIQVREKDKVFRVLARTSAGTDYSIQEDYPFPLKLEPKSDIIFNVISANGNNGSVNADFDIALL